MPEPLTAIAFDLDAASLISLRQAFPEWEIEVHNGATAGSLSRNWDPGKAHLLVVNAREDLSETLGLCRFLSYCTDFSMDSQRAVRESLGLCESRQDSVQQPVAPILVLVQSGQDTLIGAALEAGAHSCLILPVHHKDIARMLLHALAGNEPGRHTGSLEGPQREDRWRDNGGQG